MNQHSTHQTLLVAEREIRARLSSKAFVFSIGFLLLTVLASVIISAVVQKNAAESTTTVAVVSSEADQFPQLEAPGIKVQETSASDAAIALVEEGSVDAAVLASNATPTGAEIVVDDSVPGVVEALLTMQPEVTYLDPDASDGFDFIAYFLAIAFGMIFFITAMTFGNTIVQSVVEEKQTRIIEILLSTVKPRVLLVGKILGNSALALATVALAVTIASVGLLATGQDILLGALGAALIWFAVLFIFGFLLTATLYAATASLVSRLEDAGSVTTPVMMLIMIPYMLVIFFFDNHTVLTIMSYVPFSAPVGMPMRLYYGDALWWEPVAALGIILLTTVAVAAVGTRIYEGSILRTGKRVKLTEALKSVG